MIHLKNEFKSTKHFYQSFGGNSFISVKTVGYTNDDGTINERYRGHGNEFVLETEDDSCWFGKVEEIRFNGHWITISGDSYIELKYTYDDCHCNKKMYIKDSRAVDFLKDNLVEIFRQGGDEYEIIPNDDKTRFVFSSKNRYYLPVYGVIDPVNGNFLTDVEAEAEAWMRPGCQAVKFYVHYDGSIKDIVPFYNRDGFNYYEVMGDSIKTKGDDYYHFRHGEDCFFPIIATMDGNAPRDAGQDLTRFLLKIRENHPDLFSPGLMIGPALAHGNYLFENTHHDGVLGIYLPLTGESMSMEDFYERVMQDTCRSTICSLVERLEEYGETSACSDLVFDDHKTGRYRSQLEISRATDADGSDTFVLNVLGCEREITQRDLEDGYRQTVEWICYTIKMDALKKKWS